MPINSDNIALVEIFGSHDECLLSQMNAIKLSGKKLLFICSYEILSRNPEFNDYYDKVVIVDMSGSKKNKSKEIKRIWQEIKEFEASKVILNTAQGSRIRNLCFKALFSKVEFIGIIHTTLKLKGSFTQKLISWKVKKYFLLSEFLLHSIPKSKKVAIDYFYPIRYPKFHVPFSSSDEIIIAIIGGMEDRRKDLTGLIQMIKSLKSAKIKFVFLGKSDRNNPEAVRFGQFLKNEGLEDRITLFDSFVSQEIFDAHLKKANFIIPLVHPNTPSAKEYFRNQISGAMSVSFAYKIPMLIHENYEFIKEMNPAAFYYSLENFEDVLLKSNKKRAEKVAEMNSFEPYNIEFQEKRYISFLLKE